MLEVTKEAILTELKKPLDTPRGVLVVDNLRARLGISRENNTDEWLIFYKELAYCIDGGLIKFFNSFDEREYRDNFQSYIDVNFYVSHLADKAILITPDGLNWLTQSQVPQQLIELKQAVDNLNTANHGTENRIIDSIKGLDSRSLVIGIIIIVLTAIGIVIAYFHL